ncbi:MAG: preprotein translocase subunit YajC [Proteobacteria bacterium]|nr:preprotein translocase subunit YajC [Pseudomonadota bacterium]
MNTDVSGAAAAAPIARNSSWEMIIYIAVIFAVIYFLMILPNRRRMKEYQKMLEGLKVGSKILCAGGIYGVVKKISDKNLEVEIAKGVVIEIPKNAVANVE